MSEPAAKAASDEAASRRRRNRDLPVRGRWRHLKRPPAVTPQMVLAQGHRWLRFPPALEARFQADALEPHRRLVLFCVLIGIVAICLGSINIPKLLPDITQLAMNYLYGILGTCSVTLAVLVWVPKAWRRPWQSEAVTVVPVLTVNAAVIADTVASRMDTAYTHSAALVSTLMFSCIAARMRFYWALACAVTSFFAYAYFVHGGTPRQALIAQATLGLMGLSYVFALIANYAFEYGERRTWLLRQVDEQQRRELEAAARRLEVLSERDALTGLFNRRRFDGELERACAQAAASGLPMSVLMIDVDHFKRYNDTHGHVAGDASLVAVAGAIQQVAQAHQAVAARLGGEEFCVLLAGQDLKAALALGEAMCQAVRALQRPHAGSPLGHVTVSVGAAQCRLQPGRGVQALMDLADQALYRAKQSGRDQVCGPLVEPSEDAVEPDEAGRAITPHPQLPVAEGRFAEGAVRHAPPEQAFAQTLAQGFRRLRFPAEQEQRYREAQPAGRHVQLTVMSGIGLFIYMVYMWFNRPMFSDVSSTVLMGMVGLVLALVVLVSVVFATRPSNAVHEGLYILGTSMIGAYSAWLLSCSTQLTALAFSVNLVLIPMFAAAAARLSFRQTCIPAAVTCLSALILLQPHDESQQLVFVDSLTMIVTNTIFTLILSYTLEHDLRKNWLLRTISRLQGAQLEAMTAHLQSLSMRDPLTGIRNRRQFEADLQRVWADAEATNGQVALLIVDVDFFKLYNDSQGHAAGDLCLQGVAGALHRVAEASRGMASRLGGEEFALLLPGRSLSEASAMGEQVCQAVRALGIAHPDTQVAGQQHVTVSVGAACLTASADQPRRQLLLVADDALYQAKAQGRNRVRALSEPAIHDEPVMAS